MPPEKQRCLYVAMPASRKDLKPCEALAVPTSLVFAYKGITIADVDVYGAVSIKLDVYLQVVIANVVIANIMQLIERGWP